MIQLAFLLSGCTTVATAVTTTQTSRLPSSSIQANLTDLLSSVGEIRMTDIRTGETFAGSAVVLDDHHLLTNFHVLQSMQDSKFIRGRLEIYGQSIPLESTLIKDSKCDLAVGVTAIPIPGTKAKIGTGTIGQEVIMIGNFEGKGVAAINAIVGRKNRANYFLKETAWPECQLIQLTTTGIPGGSGGAVFSSDDNLVALLNAREPRAFGIGYAIDGTEIQRFLSVSDK
jgi:S1-C subfamily serine protease